jgi:hypothetical protein
MTEQQPRYVAVNRGIRIPRDGYTIVLLDAEPVSAELAAALERVAEVFGHRQQTEPAR